MRPKSAERLLNESRSALRVLRESGVVEIHDITRDPQMERFVELERRKGRQMFFRGEIRSESGDVLTQAQARWMRRSKPPSVPSGWEIRSKTTATR